MLSTSPFGRTEVIHWSSKDGSEIEGLLTYPVGYQVGQRYPLLVIIRAGGEVFSENYLANPFLLSTSYYPPAVFASQGYAVLRINSRGGALPGYGYDFSVPFFKLMTRHITT
jgi:dipeptidyl aminopeptidase/acylaminoacyl peptidase